MIAPFLIAAAAAASVAAGVASPSPASSPVPNLPTIVTVRSTAYCNAVRDTAVPLAFVNAKNEQAFDVINRSLLKFLSNSVGVRTVAPSDVSSMQNAYDDTALYNAGNTIAVDRVSDVVSQIAQNVALEQDFLRKSLKETPKGKDPALDALRQRLQNLVDLQQALANDYVTMVERYRDNEGNAQYKTDNLHLGQDDPAAQMQAYQSGSPAVYKAVLRDVIMGQAAALHDAAKDAAQGGKGPVADAGEIARNADVAQVVEQLRLQEGAFGPEMLAAGKACSN